MTTEAEFTERRARLLGPMKDLGDEELRREVGDSFSALGSALASLSEAQATWKPDEQEWSAAQIGDHVALSTGTLGSIAGLLAKGQAVTDADWDPPPQLRGDASDLANVKGRLRELPRFTDKIFDEAMSSNRLDVKANNSFLGDMNWREWFYFLRVHAQAHIEQMEKLRRMDGFPR
jgi:hypothetical protein